MVLWLLTWKDYYLDDKYYYKQYFKQKPYVCEQFYTMIIY